MADPGTITSAKEFKPTPQGLQRKWTLEIKAAEDARRKWLQEADAANKRYLGEKGSQDNRTRINLFHANIEIIIAIMYGQVPKVDVGRRFQDPNDEDARCASEALERHLNTDIEDNADDFQTEVKDALKDWKIAGLGQARIRYEADFEQRTEMDGQKVDPYEAKSHGEDVHTDYVHPRDFLWSPARRWKEVRWVGFRAEMTRDQAVQRWPKDGKSLPMQARKMGDGDTPEDLKDAWSRIEILEIWDKTEKRVHWFCPGYSRMLESKPDPLGLKGFFPCPRPLISNLTTAKFMPRPDLELDKSIYDEIDELADRLRLLVKRARVTGAYDASFSDLARILEEAVEGQLVGVKNWAAMTEKGGLLNALQFVPLDPIVKAIEVLTTKLVEKIQLLYQVTGISDIVRGQAEGKATATEQRLKAGFASTRLQTDQDEVARFATDIQRLRAEVISKHFDDETIIERSNMLRVEMVDVPDPMTGQITKQPNMDLIGRAVKLIKSDIWQYRIEVKSDAIALRDYAALKQERVETIAALAGLFQQGLPMVQLYPEAGPFLVTIGKWLIASTKGSQQLEGDFDRFAAQVESAANAPKPPPPPDPKLQAAQVKAQAEQGKASAQMQQTQLDGQVHVAKAAMDMKQATMEHQLDVAKLAAQTEAEAQRAAIARTEPQGAKQ